MLKPEDVNFINSLIKSEGKNVAEFCRLNNLPKKKFWYELKKINQTLKDMKLPGIHIENGIIKFSNELKNNWDHEKSFFNFNEFIFQEERLFMIILYTFIKNGILSNFHFQDLLNMSKNSIVLDLKKVRKICSQFNVEYIYSRSHGYDISGDEIDIRSLAGFSISKLLVNPVGEMILTYILNAWDYNEDIETINNQVMKIAKKYNVTFVYDRIKQFIFFLCFLVNRSSGNKLNIDKEDVEYVKRHPLYPMGKQIALEILNQNSDKEAIFLTIHLLGALQGTEKFHKDKLFMDLTTEIIERVKAITGSSFNDIDKLRETLFEHLVSAYFRIKFNIKIVNPFTNQIMNDYNELYYLVEKAIHPLEKVLGKKIPEDEVAYFTIHFGGQLHESTVTSKRTFKALAICPNGISSSLIMVSQLKELFPMIEFSRVNTLEQARQLENNEYDMVFSTTYFKTDRKLYIIKPILNKVEKEMLKKEVYEDFDLDRFINRIDVAKVIKIIEKHASIKNKQALYEDISSLLYGIEETWDQGVKNLTELLDKRFIQFTDKKMDWAEAIRYASKPLIENEYITEKYVDAMIENVKKIGAYIVLAPKVAIPHARPDNGVNKLGISLLHLKHPVDFNMGGENDEDRQVQLIFILAAIDNKAHLTALKQLSQILEDEDNIQKLIDAENKDEIYSLIQDILNTK